MIKVIEIREDFCSVLTRLQGEVSDVPQSGQRPPPLLVLRGPEVRTPDQGHLALPGLGLGQAASRGHHQHRCGQPQHPGSWTYVTILSGMEEKLFLSTIIA